MGRFEGPEISAYAKRDVPLIQDYGQTELDRRVLVFIGSGAAFGRPLLSPPGLPADRVTTLRRAFDATMQDSEFLAEAAKLNMDIKPLGGAEMQKDRRRGRAGLAGKPCPSEGIDRRDGKVTKWGPQQARFVT